MADKDKQPTDAERAQAVAESHAQAADAALDQTVPGGRYRVDGRLVNAKGEPISEKEN